ncbi:hypothetical protein ACFXJ8_32715 [Nonomuraea sp. NPDC059194]|uniref:hypothetical protein n=1 Tax=Nonomuraea sp. NPDC059194 TaxID=3346764 RepID=UPI0036CCC6DD
MRFKPRAFTLSIIILLLTTTTANADYSPQARSSWEPNGTVFAIQRGTSRVFLGGSFTSLHNRRTGETVAATRLAALDAATGDLIRDWRPTASDTVYDLALSPDEQRLWAAGRFTTISGTTRYRLAVLDPETGAVDAGWTTGANNAVRALALTGGRLYAGGDFTSAGGTARARLAAMDATTGALDAAWNPGATSTVYALEPTPDGTAVLVGGRFRTLGGQPRDHLGAVDAISGAVTGWTPPPGCVNTNNPCFVWDLAVMDGRAFAAVSGPGGRLLGYSLSSGARLWQVYADGDVESVSALDGKVYAAGHFAPAFGTTTRSGLAAVDAVTGAVDPSFAPRLSGTLSTYAVDAGPDFLRVGGAFQQVNSQAKTRYAEFPVLPPLTVVVPAGATWRYDASGADLGTAWREEAFDDSAWQGGPAQLGFGDGDEATALPFGRMTYYLRHTFSVADPAALTQATVDLVRDDGAIVYVNGVEVFRSNLPAGPVTASTPASATVGGTDESAWRTQPISPSLLHAGVNTIAVEVHQAAANSSDLSFDARLSVR